MRAKSVVRLLSASLIIMLAGSPLAAEVKAEPEAPLLERQIYQLVDSRNPDSVLFNKALSSDDVEMQKTALLGLARIGGQSAVDLINPFINHKNPQLRQLSALGLGLSAAPKAAPHLWQALATEQSDLVKHEIYLALGNLGEDQLISKTMARLNKEKSRAAQASLFQGLAIALTFHRDLNDDYSKLNYKKLLERFAVGDDLAARVGLFLGRIPAVENYLNAADLIILSQRNMSPFCASFLARLINKVTVKPDPANRELLAWVIEKLSDQELMVKLEAVRALKNFLDTPQGLMQIGKLQLDPHPIVAQTALNVLASSDLDTPEVIQLLKKQLKHESAAMVVEAMSGLIKRQNKAEMSWVLGMFSHPESYVKIQLMAMLKQKSEESLELDNPATAKTTEDNNFDNVIKMFSQAPQHDVRDYALKLLENKNGEDESVAISPDYADAIAATKNQLLIKTSQGDFKIQFFNEAPFTVWHFLLNVKTGYFDASYFNRVIGNFVAQGGDNIGDGSGSSGQTIREEISLLNHEAMTVGMATAGKDTGSSQFFINTGRNLHLDRNYTVFGKVIEGQDVVYQMTHGAKVISIEILADK